MHCTRSLPRPRPERLPGDPLWTFLISGSGNAKTETVQALAGAGAIVTSTIAAEGALLPRQRTRRRPRTPPAGCCASRVRSPGRPGHQGRNVDPDDELATCGRACWPRSGRLRWALVTERRYRWRSHADWQGRLVVIGAVTTAWDRAHDVIAAMGDRFVIVRMDLGICRAAGRRPEGDRQHRG